ncbi:MAG: nuclear transport factor 2 family protein [Gemmatimonadales bacterium]|nr:nuclear transport factor 2 family protein [Gemmatimonadales bacterium]
MSAVAIARRFVNAINRHDTDAMSALMTEDHRLVDPGGAIIAGRLRVVEAWEAYFRMVPDYTITVSESYAREDTSVVLGKASGSYVAPDGRRCGTWECPAAWRAATSNGRVEEWQVFADNEPIRALMRESAIPEDHA